MSQGILLLHARNELDFLSGLVGEPNANGASQIERPMALDPEECRYLLSLALEFPQLYQQTVDSQVRRVFTEPSQTVEHLQHSRAELESMADRYVGIVRMLQADTHLRAFAARHPGLDEALKKLAEALEAVGCCKTRVISDWPVCSPEENARIQSERQGGLFVPIDSAFADMKGISTTELQQKMEEHKTRRKEYGWE